MPISKSGISCQQWVQNQ